MTPEQLAERIDFIENNRAASFWIKKAWEGLKDKDPVDALHDVELLCDICLARWVNMQESVGKQ